MRSGWWFDCMWTNFLCDAQTSEYANNFVFYGMQIIFVCWKSLWILKTEAAMLREFSIENRQPERIEPMPLVELHPINICQLANKFYVYVMRFDWNAIYHIHRLFVEWSGLHMVGMYYILCKIYTLYSRWSAFHIIRTVERENFRSMQNIHSQPNKRW